MQKASNRFLQQVQDSRRRYAFEVEELKVMQGADQQLLAFKWPGLTCQVAWLRGVSPGYETPRHVMAWDLRLCSESQHVTGMFCKLSYSTEHNTSQKAW